MKKILLLALFVSSFLSINVFANTNQKCPDHIFKNGKFMFPSQDFPVSSISIPNIYNDSSKNCNYYKNNFSPSIECPSPNNCIYKLSSECSRSGFYYTDYYINYCNYSSKECKNKNEEAIYDNNTSSIKCVPKCKKDEIRGEDGKCYKKCPEKLYVFNTFLYSINEIPIPSIISTQQKCSLVKDKYTGVKCVDYLCTLRLDPKCISDNELSVKFCKYAPKNCPKENQECVPTEDNKCECIDKCPNGEKRAEDGSCVPCDEDEEYINGECKKKCPKGTQRDENGECSKCKYLPFKRCSVGSTCLGYPNITKSECQTSGELAKCKYEWFSQPASPGICETSVCVLSKCQSSPNDNNNTNPQPPQPPKDDNNTNPQPPKDDNKTNPNPPKPPKDKDDNKTKPNPPKDKDDNDNNNTDPQPPKDDNKTNPNPPKPPKDKDNNENNDNNETDPQPPSGGGGGKPTPNPKDNNKTDPKPPNDEDNKDDNYDYQGIGFDDNRTDPQPPNEDEDNGDSGDSGSGEDSGSGGDNGGDGDNNSTGGANSNGDNNTSNYGDLPNPDDIIKDSMSDINKSFNTEEINDIFENKFKSIPKDSNKTIKDSINIIKNITLSVEKTKESYEKLKHTLSGDFAHLQNANSVSCPVYLSFSFLSSGKVPLDICKEIQPLRPLFYFITYVSLMIAVLIFYIKILLSTTIK